MSEEAFTIGPAHIRALRRQTAAGDWSASGIETLLDSHQALWDENHGLRRRVDEFKMKSEARLAEVERLRVVLGRIVEGERGFKRSLMPNRCPYCGKARSEYHLAGCPTVIAEEALR